MISAGSSSSAPGNSVPILMYHSISDAPTPPTRALSVGPAAFADQLGYLQRQGFTGLTFAELCRRCRVGQPLPDRPIVLTFDDGYADNLREAAPILTRFGFPATVFVTTGWMDDASLPAVRRPPDRMLSWNQLAELSACGLEIGAHSHSHPQLDQLSERQLHAELAGPKRRTISSACAASPSIRHKSSASTVSIRAATSSRSRSPGTAMTRRSMRCSTCPASLSSR